MRAQRRWLAMVAVAALFASGCGDDGDDDAAGDDATTVDDAADSDDTADAEDAEADDSDDGGADDGGGASPGVGEPDLGGDGCTIVDQAAVEAFLEGTATVANSTGWSCDLEVAGDDELTTKRYSFFVRWSTVEDVFPNTLDASDEDVDVGQQGKINLNFGVVEWRQRPEVTASVTVAGVPQDDAMREFLIAQGQDLASKIP